MFEAVDVPSGLPVIRLVCDDSDRAFEIGHAQLVGEVASAGCRVHDLHTGTELETDEDLEELVASIAG